MVRTLVRGAAAVAAVAALLVAGQPASATAPTVRPGTVGAQDTCGYWETEYNSYYRHCDPNTRVRVYVDKSWLSVTNDYIFCADSGLHDLGYAYTTDGAWYIGELC